MNSKIQDHILEQTPSLLQKSTNQTLHNQLNKKITVAKEL